MHPNRSIPKPELSSHRPKGVSISCAFGHFWFTTLRQPSLQTSQVRPSNFTTQFTVPTSTDFLFSLPTSSPLLQRDPSITIRYFGIWSAHGLARHSAISSIDLFSPFFFFTFSLYILLIHESFDTPVFVAEERFAQGGRGNWGMRVGHEGGA